MEVEVGWASVVVVVDGESLGEGGGAEGGGVGSLGEEEEEEDGPGVE